MHQNESGLYRTLAISRVKSLPTRKCTSSGLKSLEPRCLSIRRIHKIVSSRADHVFK